MKEKMNFMQTTDVMRLMQTVTPELASQLPTIAAEDGVDLTTLLKWAIQNYVGERAMAKKFGNDW